MDHRSLSNLLLRFAGVVILISTVLAIPRTITSLSTTGSPETSLVSSLAMSVLASLLPLVIAFGLIWFPSTISNRLVDGEDQIAQPSQQLLILQQLGFSVLGIYFVSSALFDAVFWFARHRLYYAIVLENQEFLKPPPLLPDDFAGMTSTGIQFVVGLLLVLGGKGIANVIGKLRG